VLLDTKKEEYSLEYSHKIMNKNMIINKYDKRILIYKYNNIIKIKQYICVHTSNLSERIANRYMIACERMLNYNLLILNKISNMSNLINTPL
jgi:hypothetical protein